MSSIIIKKTVECEECEAEYKVRHDMSDSHYGVTFCSFCGAELEIETTLDDFIDEDGGVLFVLRKNRLLLPILRLEELECILGVPGAETGAR